MIMMQVIMIMMLVMMIMMITMIIMIMMMILITLPLRISEPKTRKVIGNSGQEAKAGNL